jgi:hypothetical protein
MKQGLVSAYDASLAAVLVAYYFNTEDEPQTVAPEAYPAADALGAFYTYNDRNSDIFTNADKVLGIYSNMPDIVDTLPKNDNTIIDDIEYIDITEVVSQSGGLIRKTASVKLKHGTAALKNLKGIGNKYITGTLSPVNVLFVLYTTSPEQMLVLTLSQWTVSGMYKIDGFNWSNSSLTTDISLIDFTLLMNDKLNSAIDLVPADVDKVFTHYDLDEYKLLVDTPLHIGYHSKVKAYGDSTATSGITKRRDYFEIPFQAVASYNVTDGFRLTPNLDGSTTSKLGALEGLLDDIIGSANPTVILVNRRTGEALKVDVQNVGGVRLFAANVASEATYFDQPVMSIDCKSVGIFAGASIFPNIYSRTKIAFKDKSQIDNLPSDIGYFKLTVHSVSTIGGVEATIADKVVRLSGVNDIAKGYMNIYPITFASPSTYKETGISVRFSTTLVSDGWSDISNPTVIAFNGILAHFDYATGDTNEYTTANYYVRNPSVSLGTVLVSGAVNTSRFGTSTEPDTWLLIINNSINSHAKPFLNNFANLKPGYFIKLFPGTTITGDRIYAAYGSKLIKIPTESIESIKYNYCAVEIFLPYLCKITLKGDLKEIARDQTISDSPLATYTVASGSVSTIVLNEPLVGGGIDITGLIVKIASGTGAGQVNIVQSYVKSTKTITLGNDLVTAPNSTSTVELYENTGSNIDSSFLVVDIGPFKKLNDILYDIFKATSYPFNKLGKTYSTLFGDQTVNNTAVDYGPYVSAKIYNETLTQVLDTLLYEACASLYYRDGKLQLLYNQYHDIEHTNSVKSIGCEDVATDPIELGDQYLLSSKVNYSRVIDSSKLIEKSIGVSIGNGNTENNGREIIVYSGDCSPALEAITIFEPTETLPVYLKASYISSDYDSQTKMLDSRGKALSSRDNILQFDLKHIKDIQSAAFFCGAVCSPGSGSIKQINCTTRNINCRVTLHNYMLEPGDTLYFNTPELLDENSILSIPSAADQAYIPDLVIGAYGKAGPGALVYSHAGTIYPIGANNAYGYALETAGSKKKFFPLQAGLCTIDRITTHIELDKSYVDIVAKQMSPLLYCNIKESAKNGFINPDVIQDGVADMHGVTNPVYGDGLGSPHSNGGSTLGACDCTPGGTKDDDPQGGGDTTEPIPADPPCRDGFHPVIVADPASITVYNSSVEAADLIAKYSTGDLPFTIVRVQIIINGGHGSNTVNSGESGVYLYLDKTVLSPPAPTPCSETIGQLTVDSGFISEYLQSGSTTIQLMFYGTYKRPCFETLELGVIAVNVTFQLDPLGSVIYS